MFLFEILGIGFDAVNEVNHDQTKYYVGIKVANGIDSNGNESNSLISAKVES